MRKGVKWLYFNPRPPCGGRPIRFEFDGTFHLFQSTSSVWRTTSGAVNSAKGKKFQSTSSVWRTTLARLFRYTEDSYFNPRPPCGGRRTAMAKRGVAVAFQSTSSVWRTTAKTEKNLYLHSYNTAICTDFQPKHRAYAFVCTNKDKQSPEKLVRSIRVRSARFAFARPMPPGEALRKSARHPDGRRGELRCVQPCFGNGCPAGKSAGCPLPGRSIWPVRP